MTHSDLPRLSLGPVPYHWSRQTLLDFYARMADSPVDILYLGETVCGKRRAMRPEDWLALAEELRQAGKEVVLSTLTLVESQSDLQALRRLCRDDRFAVEANDMAAVQQLQGRNFIAGPALNLYNSRSLRRLYGLGLRRWAAPLELSRTALADLLRDREPGLEVEIFAYGRMPLAWSARCFTARAHNLPKDDCRFLCGEDPDGMLLHTRENQPFLVLNGIQIQSASRCNLLAALPELCQLGVDVLRVSPQARHTRRIVESFHHCLRHPDRIAPELEALQALADEPGCDGYWRGAPGIQSVR